MNPKMLAFAFTYATLSLILVSGGKLDDKESNTYKHALENSLSSEETPQAGINKRWFGFLKSKINKFRKAVDQQQRLDLELATETTRLEELEKLREAETIDDNTAYDKLSSWQVKLLKDIAKTKKIKEDLSVRAGVANALAEKLSALNEDSTRSESQIKDRSNKLSKALLDQAKVNLELALATKKLEELQSQKEAEEIDISIAPVKLTRWQQNLLSDIVKTKEKKEYLTVDAAVAKTKVDKLKQHVSDVGGLPDNVVTNTANKMKKQISEKVHKAEKTLMRMKMDLELATTKLEQLKLQRQDETVYDKNSRKKLKSSYKNLLNDIEKTKEKKYDLTLKAALEEQTIDHLKPKLNAVDGKTSNNSTQ